MKYLPFIVLILILSTHAFSQETLSDRLKSHVGILASDSLEGRGLGTEGHFKAFQYIQSQMKEIGLNPFEDGSYVHEFFYKSQLVHVKGKNIVGILPGSDPILKDEVIVIGAHYDHVGYELLPNGNKQLFPGADDNASGVAGMLEIARLIINNEIKPGRSIVFVAFDAEESGLIGSYRFVEAIKPFENSAIKAMFSLDMIGMYGKYNGLDLKGWESLEDAKVLLDRAQAKSSLTIKKMDGSFERRTDTWPFAMAGIPSIHVFTGLISPYHKPEDTADLLDYTGMSQIVHFISSLIGEMSMVEKLVPVSFFVPGKSVSSNKLTFGAQIGLGNSHNRHVMESFRANGVLAWEAGVYGSLNLTTNLQLVVSSLFDSNGSTVPYFGGGNFRRYSMTVPALIRLTTGLSKYDLGTAFVGAGAYFRYHFSQKFPKEEELVFGQPTSTSWDFPNQEWGLNFQFGYQINRFTLTFDWRNALSAPFKLDTRPDLEVYNRNFRVGLAYAFGK